MDSNLEEYARFLIVQQGYSIEQAQEKMREMAGAELAERAVEVVRREISAIVAMPDPFFLADADRSDWYPGPREGDRFWPPYRDRLQTKGWDGEDIRLLDRASSRVLQLMRSPGAANIRTRGLVVGYVQSGKTANYAATVAKAADAGYRLIVVLAGATNVLRRQTQARLQEDLVHRPEEWVLLTTEDADFVGGPNAASSLTSATNQRTIAVIKKNRARLRKLSGWLRSAGELILAKCPVLVIDDEADQASPNSAMPDAERTAINRCLMELLKVGPKVAYVGYTATPFANLLINPADSDDLYPRSFVIDLPRPVSYFGPEKIFGREPVSAEEAESPFEGLDMLRSISVEDQQTLAHINAGNSEDLPDSLRTALRYFIMVTAERHRRGQNDRHSSMLVHTSQKIVAHRGMIAPLERELATLRAALATPSGPVLSEMKQIWIEEQGRVATPSSAPHQDFDTLLPLLREVLARANVVIENSNSTRRLDYRKPGQVVIAVGGNVLARGLTLEGLSVSYFIRSASAYDTLLQMGRWFGYRHGYEDLPRIWMTKELQGFFFDLGTVEAEIRKEIARYETIPGMTPLTAGVRIRTHPTLAVTAKAKMASAVRSSMSFRGRRFQTTIVANRDSTRLLDNLAAARALLASLAHLPSRWIPERAAHLVRAASVESVLRFLDAYFITRHPELEDKSLLVRYIKAQSEKGNLTIWNIAVASRVSARYGQINLPHLGDVNCIRRTHQRARSTVDGDSIGALMSERDVALDVPESIDVKRLSGDLLVRRNQETAGEGLLVLYPIAPNVPPDASSTTRSELKADHTVIGIALVFPDREDGEPMSYLTADLSTVPREQVASVRELGADEDEEGDS